MSIQVKNIIKVYGKQKALNGISFQTNENSVIGILGPNGAGKSTLMKILTCFIPQSSGEAFVCKHNVSSETLEVRKNIGYLPEHNPLYLDMYVKEYLDFIAGIHQIKNKQERIKEMISITGLEIEKHKKIGALSKGYRQRVGLAQALIHDPKVLILDEPTSGLDPNQLDEIRHLIRKTGKEKTVLLSTHIMQEVEAVCSRVIILNRGEIVADGPTSEISKKSGNHQIITVEFDKPADLSRLEKIHSKIQIQKIRDTKYKIHIEGEKDIRPDIFKFAVENNLIVLESSKEVQKLEEVFRQLTTK